MLTNREGLRQLPALKIRFMSGSVRLNSHMRFLSVNYCVNFSVHAIAKRKWVHNPLLNFSVHTIVDQIAGVNAPI